MTDTHRPLSRREANFLAAVAEASWPGATALGESLAHLIVTDTCGCGCQSFTVRDTRYPVQSQELEHWCSAMSADGRDVAELYVGSAGRPLAVDVEPDADVPEPTGLLVVPPPR